jgi:multidrug transporter EmrE-like cation transporter
MPLHVIFPLTTGLAVIGVQVVAAKMLFGETISHAQWWGTLLIVAGVVLLGEH